MSDKELNDVLGTLSTKAREKLIADAKAQQVKEDAKTEKLQEQEEYKEQILMALNTVVDQNCDISVRDGNITVKLVGTSRHKKTQTVVDQAIEQTGMNTDELIAEAQLDEEYNLADTPEDKAEVLTHAAQLILNTIE